jgi:chemotaxis protein CheC
MNEQIKIDKPTVDNSNSPNEQEIDLSILLELGSMGAGHAATALSEIIQQPISIEVPRIITLQPHVIPKFFNMHETPTTAVFMELSQSYECDILLAFEPSEAKKIAAMMSCVASIEELNPEMETSAIHELANILIGAFLTAISDFLGVVLFPTPPQSVVDVFDAIIDGFLIKQSMNSENALIFETKFKRSDEDAKCILVIFPSEQLKNALAKRCKRLI